MRWYDRVTRLMRPLNDFNGPGSIFRVSAELRPV